MSDIKFRVLASVVGAQSIDNLKKSVDGISGAVKTFGTAVAGSAVALYVRSLINMGDELQALSEKTGIASNTLYGFKIAGETANLSLEQLSGNLTKFSKGLGGIATGTGESAKALKVLGINAFGAGGGLRESGDIIIDLAGKFEKMKDGPEKARLAIALFGRAGMDMIPFLNQGAAALSEFGNAFGADFAARADAFNDTIAKIGAKIQVFSINALQNLLPTMQEIVSAFASIPNSSNGVVGAMDIIGEAIRILAIGFKVFVDSFIQGVDTIILLSKNMADHIGALFTNSGDLLATYASQVKNRILFNYAEADRLGKEFSERADKRSQESELRNSRRLDEFAERTKARALELEAFTKKLTKNSLLFGEGSVDEIKKRQQAGTSPAKPRTSGGTPDLRGLSGQVQSETDAIKKYLAVQAEQIEQEKLKLSQYQYTRAEYEKLVEAKKIDIEATKASANMSDEGRRKYLEAAEAVKAQRMALLDLAETQRGSWQVGAQDALNDYVDSVKDVAGQTKKLMTDAFKGMEDALVGFCMTGKMNFTDMANSIIDDLIRIAIRQSITGPLAAGLGGLFGGAGGFSGGAGGGGSGFAASPTAGFAMGGIMTSGGPMALNKYANGGIARSPQLALFGENQQPEAFVPLPDGRRIPVSMNGGAGGGDTFNISVSVSEGGAVSSEGDSAKGRQIAGLIASGTRAVIMQEKKPGGLLYG